MGDLEFKLNSTDIHQNSEIIGKIEVSYPGRYDGVVVNTTILDSNEFQIETKTITEKQYEILHKKIVKHFGPYCGYAQQFLFKMERENYNKKWL